jgi:ribosome-binding factor A
MQERNDRFLEEIKKLAAEYLEANSNRTSLVTVTRISLNKTRKHATILVTVLPQTQEKAVVDFTKRRVRDFRNFVQKRVPNRYIPFFEFALDEGEKNRQKIEDLLNE